MSEILALVTYLDELNNKKVQMEEKHVELLESKSNSKRYFDNKRNLH